MRHEVPGQDLRFIWLALGVIIIASLVIWLGG